MTRLTCLFSILLFACGTSSRHSDSPPDAAAVDDAPVDDPTVCTDLAQAMCQLRDQCTTGGQITRAFGDLTTCVQRETLACTTEMQVADSGHTPQTARACTDAYASLSCSDLFDNNLPGACLSTGTRSAGGACAFNSQCETGYCSGIKTASCGTCGNPPSVGADCSHTSCGAGQSCDARTNTCVALEPAGAACDNNTQPCGFALACAGNTTGPRGALGTCTAELSEQGDACNGSMSGECDVHDDLACTGVSGARTCAIATWGHDGDPCGAQPMGNINCGDGGNCYDGGALAQAGATGICKAAVPEGSACDIVAGPPCLTPARCVVDGTGTSGTCALANPASCDP